MPSPSRYPVLAAECGAEQTLSRSRFLARLCPADSVERAQAFVVRCRAASPEATHHCWAYLVGPPGSTAAVGLSDDGEPHGTAGRPMLELLLHSGLGDLAAVVSRWYGGTKLGKGGLVRAYGGTLGLALEGAPTALATTWVELTLTMAYARVPAVRHRYQQHEVQLLQQSFGEQVSHRLRLPLERREAFEIAVRDATAGRIQVSGSVP